MQRSWEYKIKEGIFIAPKWDRRSPNENEEIIKSKGINLDVADRWSAPKGNKILNKNDLGPGGNKIIFRLKYY